MNQKTQQNMINQNLQDFLDTLLQEETRDNIIDDVVHFCERQNIDILTVAEIIKTTPVLKDKLQLAAENLNFLKKTARLPL